MKTALLCSLAAPLIAYAGSGQISRDVTEIRPDNVRPQIAYLCRAVPLGTIEAFTSISGLVEGDRLTFTVKGKCFGQKPRNLVLSIFPQTQRIGQPPAGTVALLPPASWNSSSANYITVPQDTVPIRDAFNDPVFMLSLSGSNRTYVTRLSEDEFNVLQSGGTITNPAIQLNRP